MTLPKELEGDKLEDASRKMSLYTTESPLGKDLSRQIEVFVVNSINSCKHQEDVLFGLTRGECF